ncbi:SAM-dependent methyltransferase [Rhodoferax antarcticus]|uniref:SAM-dependent methyltransferase n=1 Tax=Rhodoferax antarcticus TaxID=81479 RepID=UPI00094F4F1E|nr:SAM-dependent methyltransferase [Rhodoferax antarcticus]APW47855.1 SAM-dependent methyltransferase [Rhodoferax antarcticus]MCW2312302.1 hypothetical protein [Rhodoferax antarcticus]
MNTDFLDAHRRHLCDADALFSASRLANADHLYGMAAECGLKRLMVAFGMQTDPIGSPADRKTDWIHADKVWVRYETYRSGHLDGTQYALSASNPFIDWKVEQRYAQEQNFNLGRVEPHRTAAQHVHALIKNAEKAGLI